MVVLTAAALSSAVLLAPPGGALPSRALSWLLFTASSAHVASTGWLFTVPAVRTYARAHRVRCLWLPAGLVAAAATTAAAISPAAFGWLLLPYFGWQLHHFSKQNVGMASLAAAAGRAGALQRGELWPLLLTGWSGAAALLSRPGLLGLRLEGPAGRGLAAHSALACAGHAVFLAAAAMFAVSAAAGVIALARRPAFRRSREFCLAYLACLLFFVPAFMFGSPYAAAGGLTIAHGLQYLLLVGIIAGGAAPGTGPPAGFSRVIRLAALANVAFIGGAVLSVASHLHDAGPAGGLAFGAYLGVVMAHFVLDAGLWRMRDPLARAFMVTSVPFLVPATDRSATDIRCAA